MSCKRCGSVNTGCGCFIQTGPSCDSGCSPALPGTPTPFYNSTPSCEQDHCQTVVNNYFSTAILNQYRFNMPACDEQVSVYFPQVKVLAVGAYVWNVTYGYLVVAAFNPINGEAILVNRCTLGNAEPGTSIPACTPFLTAPPPVAVDSVATTIYGATVVAVGSINSNGDALSTDEVELIIPNTSTTRVMNVQLNVRLNAQYTQAIGQNSVQHSIGVNVNDGGYSDTVILVQTENTITAPQSYSRQTITAPVYTIAPGGSLNLKYRGKILHYDNGAAAINIAVTNLNMIIEGLGFAL